MKWDRDKQKHWIDTHSELWRVLDSKTNEYVCDIAPTHDKDLHTKICFSEDVEEIKKLCNESIEEYEEYKRLWDIMNAQRK